MATLTPTFTVLILTAHAGITPIFKSHVLAQLEGCGCLVLSTELLISPFVDSVSMAHLLAYEQTRDRPRHTEVQLLWQRSASGQWVWGGLGGCPASHRISLTCLIGCPFDPTNRWLVVGLPRARCTCSRHIGRSASDPSW